MKLIRCPLNGPRNISEFVWGGEFSAPPDDAEPDSRWIDYLYTYANPAGVVREWWYHVPSGYWLIAERNTVTDEILRTYPPEDLIPQADTSS